VGLNLGPKRNKSRGFCQANKETKPKNSFCFNAEQQIEHRGVLTVQDTLHVPCCVKTECISLESCVVIVQALNVQQFTPGRR